MTYTRFGSPNPKRNFVQKQSIGVLERKHNLLTQVSPSPENDFEYTPHEAVLLARYMQHLNTINLETGWSFGQQYMFERGIKIFGDRGWKGGMKELTQLNDREVFAPRLENELTTEEKMKAQEALLLLTEKRDSTIKGRMVYNGKPTRAWYEKEDSARPTASNDAKEGRDVMTGDVPDVGIYGF